METDLPSLCSLGRNGVTGLPEREPTHKEVAADFWKMFSLLCLFGNSSGTMASPLHISCPSVIMITEDTRSDCRVLMCPTLLTVAKEPLCFGMLIGMTAASTLAEFLIVLYLWYLQSDWHENKL